MRSPAARFRLSGAANAWIRDVYLPVHDARFAKPAALPETGFVTVHDQAQLVEALCRQEERVVARDNTIAFDVEILRPGPGQVLVEVSYTAVQPIEWKIREGYVKEEMPLPLPYTLGVDLVGGVKALAMVRRVSSSASAG